MNDYAETIIRVRYAETDQMGIVYYGNYFTWFEIGRVELCRQLGFEYKRIGNRGRQLHHCGRSCTAATKRPARFDDVLAIRTV